ASRWSSSHRRSTSGGVSRPVAEPPTLRARLAPREPDLLGEAPRARAPNRPLTARPSLPLPRPGTAPASPRLRATETPSRPLSALDRGPLVCQSDGRGGSPEHGPGRRVEMRRLLVMLGGAATLVVGLASAAGAQTTYPINVGGIQVSRAATNVSGASGNLAF